MSQKQGNISNPTKFTAIQRDNENNSITGHEGKIGSTDHKIQAINLSEATRLE